jgi:hypothetical protein
MTNEEAIKEIQRFIDGCPFADTEEAFNLAIKALNHETYWEDVKKALNGWLNNTTSPNTALNEIYRAYMGRGAEE